MSKIFLILSFVLKNQFLGQRNVEKTISFQEKVLLQQEITSNPPLLYEMFLKRTISVQMNFRDYLAAKMNPEIRAFFWIWS